ncbi:MAG TPA: hypothetical protein VMD99_17515 [Terriglobales bacterium]|nr:hypothetical protein [Terriglobales bacterium]
MPLYENAAALIRANLEQFRPDVKVKVKAVAIGTLSDVQLAAIHAKQQEEELPLITGEVLFIGWHIYKSRVLRDGYTIDDVVDQIVSGMSCDSVVLEDASMTAMENPNARRDRYGNDVRDRVVFECMARHPRPELFGVMPKGDLVKPQKMAKAAPEGTA